MGYFTSISSNYHATGLDSSEYRVYMEREEIVNEPYQNIFRSIVKVFGNNWILEHNELLSDNDILIVKTIARKYSEIWKKEILACDICF